MAQPMTKALWGDRTKEEALPPWKWSWARWRVGDGWTFFWILWIHAFAIAGLLLTPVPGWTVGVIALSLMFMGGFGTTICYHRALAHKALKLSKPTEFLLTVFALFNGSGTPATWTANHRHHHAKVETPDDISSPRIGGVWGGQLRWLFPAGRGLVPRRGAGLRSGPQPWGGGGLGRGPPGWRLLRVGGA